MSKLNIKTRPDPIFTNEGGPAVHIDAVQQLRRSVMSCFLWEDEFYEDGESIAERIIKTAAQVPPSTLAQIAIDTRSKGNLRHVSLLMLSVLCKTGSGSSLVSETIRDTIQRADELAEFVAVYAKVNSVSPNAVKKKLSSQAKHGLAMAFQKFNAYGLAKYNRDGAVKLRDVLMLCHAKPKNDEQAEVFKKLIEGNLESPDTWEVALSGGADKKETFERLIREEKLGYLALLRNLRNMVEAGCDLDLVRHAILTRKGGAEKLLPFRFTAAARVVPLLEPELDISLQTTIRSLPSLYGETVVLVDVSGSMDDKLSGKSDLMRIDAAATLASIINADKLRVFSFSDELVEVPPRRGMAGVDAIIKSQIHKGTKLGAAVEQVSRLCKNMTRLIVITDEQSHDRVNAPGNGVKAYMLNVASNKNGVGYGKWTHIDGFSENVIRFIYELENSQ